MGNVTDEEVEPIDPCRPCLRPREAFDTFRELRPCLHLPLKQFFYFVNHLLRESFSHSNLNLDSSKPVLVQIVSIRNFEWQRAVAITFPSAAKINGVVDAADLIITADAQRYGVILSIADIRKSDTAQNRCIECARRAKTIDAERIVSPVLAAPLAMVNQTGRNLLQRKIDHRIGTYDHRVRSSFKFRNDPAQDAVIDVEVVRIKLDRVLSAVPRVNRLVPASADSKVPAFGNDVFHPRIADTAQDFRRSIGRMIIDHDHIKFEISALGEGALNGVENCPLAIPNRDNDAGFYRKCFRRGWNALEVRLQPGANSFEMRRRDALHLDLIITIARIYIIELLLTRRPRIDHRRVVQRFGNPHDSVFFRNP